MIESITYEHDMHIREWFIDNTRYNVGDTSHYDFAKQWFKVHNIDVDGLDPHEINNKFINDHNAIRFWDGVFEMNYKSNNSLSVIKQHLQDYKFLMNIKVYLDFVEDNSSYKETVENILNAKTIRDLEKL